MRLFSEMLEIDSTSGNELGFGRWCYDTLQAPHKDFLDFGAGAFAVLLRWSLNPKLVFCTHLDTVPPYFEPAFGDDVITGRGACDAKGQIFSMYKACLELEAKGESSFALLLLSGEETGSFGAKAFARTDFRAPFLVVGEPTENLLVSASKGTKSFDIQFLGSAFHSGYPEFGSSAVDMFSAFYASLASKGRFSFDPVLGETTWNFGKIVSDNPQNVLSPELRCKLYFRTTFASDEAVVEFIRAAASSNLVVKENGGDAPAYYYTVPGIPTTTVSFGSDAPHLVNFTHKMICGPGSIRYAHTLCEQIRVDEISQAVNNYINIYETCN